MADTRVRKAIHVSDVRLFKRCRRWWDFASPLRMNLDSTRPNKNLLTGSGVHEALAAGYPLGGSFDPDLTINCYQDWFVEQVTALEANPSVGDELRATLMESLQLGLDVLKHYTLWAPRYEEKGPEGLRIAEVIATEVRIEIPLFQLGLANVYFEGTSDAYVRLGNGLYALVEHKTAGQMPDTSLLFIDEQCISGGTPIQMADGSERPIEEIQVGDEILGLNDASQIVATTVTRFTPKGDHSCVTLNGLELTPDHQVRIFAGSGIEWVPVSNLVNYGTARVTQLPPVWDWDPASWLAGYLDGDGCFSWDGPYLHFQSGSIDAELSQRVVQVLESFGFHPNATTNTTQLSKKPFYLVQKTGKEAIQLQQFVEGHREGPSYLGGFFDADGTMSSGDHPSFCQKPGLKHTYICARLDEAGFEFRVQERKIGSADIIHILGGQPEWYRFFAKCRPQLQRKWKRLLNRRPRGMYTPAELDMTLLTPRPVYDLTTGTGNFFAGGVLVHNCSAYLWAAQLDPAFKDHKPRAMLYNFLIKKIPSKPAELLGGALSQKKSLNTTFEAYLKEIRDRGLDPKDYQAMLHHLYDKGADNFFMRVRVDKTNKALIAFGRLFLDTLAVMLDPGVPIYPSPDWFHCKYCPFREPCLMLLEGVPAGPILRAEFQKRKPRWPEVSLEE